MEEIINVSNLRKSFGELEILKGISFSVHKGEVLSIIGPSGSGKSTILRCISQLESVTDGTISICGKTLVENGVYADKNDKTARPRSFSDVLDIFMATYSVPNFFAGLVLTIIGNGIYRSNKKSIEKSNLSDFYQRQVKGYKKLIF